MFSTTARGNGRFKIGNILTEYADTEYWQAETDVEFIELMDWFAEFIKNYGISVLDDMLIEKPDSFETPERKQWFKEHKEELLNKYETRYHFNMRTSINFVNAQVFTFIKDFIKY